jgi:hypothetical protein
MAAIRTKIIDGRITFNAPAEIPDGTEVLVELTPILDDAMISDSDWDNSPDSVSDWLSWCQSLEPLVFTEQELLELDADRKSRKQWEFLQFESRAKALSENWR